MYVDITTKYEYSKTQRQVLKVRAGDDPRVSSRFLGSEIRAANILNVARDEYEIRDIMCNCEPMQDLSRTLRLRAYTENEPSGHICFYSNEAATESRII